MKIQYEKPPPDSPLASPSSLASQNQKENQLKSMKINENSLKTLLWSLPQPPKINEKSIKINERSLKIQQKSMKI